MPRKSKVPQPPVEEPQLDPEAGEPVNEAEPPNGNHHPNNHDLGLSPEDLELNRQEMELNAHELQLNEDELELSAQMQMNDQQLDNMDVMIVSEDDFEPQDHTQPPEVPQNEPEVDEKLACAPAPAVDIKLFIARIPKTYEEEEIRKLFDKFGRVKDVFVIRDKNTNIHKNCAFVKMASICQADAAIRNLNHRCVVDPTLGTVQIRYATGEPERLGFTPLVGEPGVDSAKLFVGSLPTEVGEERLYEIFKEYGTPLETFVLKDLSSGGNKGCGFVRMKYKEQALYAIQGLDGKKMLEGSVRPIEVRFAQNKSYMSPSDYQAGTRKRPPAPFPNHGVNPNKGFPGPYNQFNPGHFNHFNPNGFNNFHQNYNGPGNFNPPNNFNNFKKRRVPDKSVGYASYNNGNPRQAGHWKEYISPDGRFYYYNVDTGATQWEVPKEFLNMGGAGPGPGAPTTPGFLGDGDDTCLFVFHIPRQWTNSDLFRTFSPFGRVVRAKIVIDRMTNRSRGFAFVSYDNPESATQAVANMNGFNIMGKKLKVTYKSARPTPY